MQHLIGVAVLGRKTPRTSPRIPNIDLMELERALPGAWPGTQPFQVLADAVASQVVHHNYLVAALQVPAAGIAPDEAGPSGDDGLHFCHLLDRYLEETVTGDSWCSVEESSSISACTISLTKPEKFTVGSQPRTLRALL